MGFALRPSHNQNLFSLSYCLDPHGNSSLRNIIDPLKVISCIFSSDSMQVDQPSDTINGWWRFIKTYMSCPSNTQDLNIDPPIRFDFMLIICTKLSDFWPIDLSIRNVNIFLGDVYVVEEVDVHVIVIGFGVVVGYWIIFIQIESHHVFKS